MAGMTRKRKKMQAKRNDVGQPRSRSKNMGTPRFPTENWRPKNKRLAGKRIYYQRSYLGVLCCEQAFTLSVACGWEWKNELPELEDRLRL
jgi:hypothetical protein